MTETTVTMSAQEVVDMLAAAAEGMHAVVLERLTVSSVFVRELMKLKAPVGVGGDNGLRGSIKEEIDPLTMSAEIKPTVDYGDAVETGSRPHWPPHGPDSPLAAWAKLKGINVYALAASIAKKGTKAHPYIQPTYDAVEPEVAPIFASGIDAFIRGLMA